MKNQEPSKGDLSNAWWRSMRVLFEEGRPLQPHTRLIASPTKNESAPFGVLAKTNAGPDRHRLIYWPPLPKGLPEPTAEHPHQITDHITLDLWNGKSHPTWYEHDGKSASPDESQGWKLTPLEGQGLAHWFTILIQHSVLDEQDCEVEANVHMPPGDAQRRVEEYTKHAQTSPTSIVKFPPLPQAGNYACCTFFVVTDPAWQPLDLRPLARFIEQFPIWHRVNITGAEEPCLSTGSVADVQGTRVAIVTACPGGAISERWEMAMPLSLF